MAAEVEQKPEFRSYGSESSPCDYLKLLLHDPFSDIPRVTMYTPRNDSILSLAYFERSADTA